MRRNNPDWQEGDLCLVPLFFPGFTMRVPAILIERSMDYNEHGDRYPRWKVIFEWEDGTRETEIWEWQIEPFKE